MPGDGAVGTYPSADVEALYVIIELSQPLI
jgi:hypothetical protein